MELMIKKTNSFLTESSLKLNALKTNSLMFHIWKEEGYRCASFRKKYMVAYLDLEKEVVICDFTSHKLLKF